MPPSLQPKQGIIRNTSCKHKNKIELMHLFTLGGRGSGVKQLECFVYVLAIAFDQCSEREFLTFRFKITPSCLIEWNQLVSGTDTCYRKDKLCCYICLPTCSSTFLELCSTEKYCIFRIHIRCPCKQWSDCFHAGRGTKRGCPPS